MHWQIIHIPQAHRNPAQERNYTEFSQHIEHFTVQRFPRPLCLPHRSLDIQVGNTGAEFSILASVTLLALIGVLSTAFETDLVFVGQKGRLIPIDQWVESLLKPLVGVGLVFLLGGLLEKRGVEMLHCSTAFLAILYGSAIVGIAYQWGYSSWRGESALI